MGSALNQERELRVAGNRAIFRALNDKILDMNEVFGALLGTFAIACECSRIDCVELLEIPGDAYRAVRGNPRTFVVLPEHVEPALEQVLSNRDGYTVVEVLGSGARVAQATLPLWVEKPPSARGEQGSSGLDGDASPKPPSSPLKNSPKTRPVAAASTSRRPRRSRRTAQP